VPARWYVDVPDVGREDAEWLELMELSLAEDLAGFQSEYPDVQVARAFERSSSAADALCRRSEGAAMLVVGKRGLGGVVGLGLGWTARSVLAHASCPVVVVHDRVHEPSDNRVPTVASVQPQP
jgi:nucleotide-binding universal stress UspA family protein